MTASHRYRVALFGEEGHNVEIELLARAESQPALIEKESAPEEKSWLPPAWALIGGILLISLVPAAFARRQRQVKPHMER